MDNSLNFIIKAVIEKEDNKLKLNTNYEKVVYTCYCIKNNIKPNLKLLPFITETKLFDGNTCAMYWIMYNKNIEVPYQLRHVQTVQNNDGNTCAMLWIIFNRTKPPKFWLHDKNLTNFNELTMETLWYRYCTTKVPNELVCKQKQISKEDIKTVKKFVLTQLDSDLLYRAYDIYKIFVKYCKNMDIDEYIDENEFHRIISKFCTKTEFYDVVFYQRTLFNKLKE